MATITANRRPTSRYRAPVPPRHLPPMPAQWIPAARAFREPPPLAHFVLLSMLLHTLFIVLFGAPSGGSREGRAMWGTMQVELRGLLIDSGRAPFPVPSAEAPEREAVPAPPAPAREDRGTTEGAVPMTRPAETEAAAVAPSGPAIVEVPAPFPPLLDRLMRREPRLDEPPPLRVPPPTAGRDLRPPPRERPEPSSIEVSAPLPLAPAPPAERILGEPPVVAAPILQPVPAPLPASESRAPAPVEAIAPPAPVARPVETPAVEVQAIPVPTLETVAVPRSDVARPVEMAPMPDIRIAPAPPAPVERVQPQFPAAPARADPETRPTPREIARERAGRHSDDTAAPYDPTAPSLDAEALRKRAGEMAREGAGQRAILAFPMPPVPEKKSQMQSAIENARKPDCRTAYQGLGLAAIVPLIANEFGEGKCRW